jgi:hypothetical protein
MAGFWLGWLLHTGVHYSQTINQSLGRAFPPRRDPSQHINSQLVRAWTKSVGGQLE